MLCNQRTWFAHLFRTQGGDFGFPYPLHAADQARARAHSRALWLEGGWPQAVRPLSWLVNHFAPVPTWDEEPARAPAVQTRRTSGVIYYSDNQPDPALLDVCREQLMWAAHGRPMVSCTLAPVSLGHNIVLPLERGYLTMAVQILTALEALDTDTVFHAEHDVLYHPAHFAYDVADTQTYVYNQATWKVDWTTGRAVHYRCNQLSGLCADRALLIQHFRARVDRLAKVGFTRDLGFEPGTHRPPRGLDDYPHAVRMATAPNIDLRHAQNLTRTRWSPSQFRDQRFCQGWQEADAVPGWGVTRGRMAAFVAGLPRWRSEHDAQV
jgi:hypothetical protein